MQGNNYLATPRKPYHNKKKQSAHVLASWRTFSANN